MKTAIVPAQVTTVEDRLAGNLTISQLRLMVAGLGVATRIYVLVGPKYHITLLKGLIAAATMIAFIGLSIRIRGKILADWIIILTRFVQRPRRYVFTKNDLATRTTIILTEEPEQLVTATPLLTERSQAKSLSVREQVKVGSLLENPALAIRFAVGEKGGLDVSLTPLKR